MEENFGYGIGIAGKESDLESGTGMPYWDSRPYRDVLP